MSLPEPMASRSLEARLPTSAAPALVRDPVSGFAPMAQEPRTSATAADPVSGLFAGDTGELGVETRRVLVQLLLGPSLDARRHGRLWPVLLRDEPIVRRRLHELFLDLVVDRDHQVAFTRQTQADEIDVPVLLRRSPLTFLDSVLLLFLRQRLTQAEAQGERAVVSVDEMSEHMAIFERQSNTDKALFAKRVRNAIEKMKQDNVLQRIRSSEDRLEVSPTLRLLFSAEEILALTHAYRALASENERGGAHIDVDGSRAAATGETNQHRTTENAEPEQSDAEGA